MSAWITPRPRAADTHAGALDAALAGKAHRVTHVLLEVKRASEGWRLFQDLDIVNTEETPRAPDEIRDALLEYIRSEQDLSGPGKFRVSLFGLNKEGAEERIALVDSGFEPPATADVRATAESSVMVDAMRQSSIEKAEMHKHYIELLKISMAVPATFVEVVKSIPENLRANTEFYQYKGKALELMFADKKEERASAERIETERIESETRERMWSKLTAKLEPLAEMWLLKIMADAGLDPTTGGSATDAGATAGGAPTTVRQEPSKKAETIKAFCKSLTNDEKTKIILALDGDSDGDMGGDALAVLFGAGNALTDQACEACLRRLKEMLAGRDTMWIAMTLRSIVGDRVVPLIPILKPIWEEK